MIKFTKAFARLIRDDKGTEATSIALGIVLIALVAGLGMVQFGEQLGLFFHNNAVALSTAAPGTIPPQPTIPSVP
jgi:Flp pilus assembly pilin Flp